MPDTEPLWTAIGAVADLAFDPAHLARVADHEIAIFETDGGGYTALENTCPHAGGPLAEGYLEGGFVACPWHGWRFEAATGQCEQIPDCRVDTFPVRVRDGRLELGLPQPR